MKGAWLARKQSSSSVLPPLERVNEHSKTEHDQNDTYGAKNRISVCVVRILVLSVRVRPLSIVFHLSTIGIEVGFIEL